MQALASRLWTPEARHHPGQLAWSYAYGPPEVLHHGPAVVFGRDDEVVAWAWAESDDWMELCVDPTALDAGDAAIGWFLDRAGGSAVRTMVLDTEEHVIALLDRAGFLVEDGPWFTHHHLDLADLEDLEVGGYTFRHVELDEAAHRAACHRDAWSATSAVSTGAYERLMRDAALPPRPRLGRPRRFGADGRLGVRVAGPGNRRGPGRAGRLPARAPRPRPRGGGERRRPPGGS